MYSEGLSGFCAVCTAPQQPHGPTLRGDEGEALSSGRRGGIASFLDHTSEDSFKGASPQQTGPCDHLAGLEEGSFPKWEEPCPAQHEEAMLPWALMPVGNGRLARRFPLTYSIGLHASCERQGLSTEKCPVRPDVEASRTQLPGLVTPERFLILSLRKPEKRATSSTFSQVIVGVQA